MKNIKREIEKSDYKSNIDFGIDLWPEMENKTPMGRKVICNKVDRLSKSDNNEIIKTAKLLKTTPNKLLGHEE
jgi:hypothetical protein